jgi:hypothetical protein
VQNLEQQEGADMSKHSKNNNEIALSMQDIKTTILSHFTAHALRYEALSSQPKRLRLLLVAAYLAAHNPITTDNLTILGESVKKRKASQLSSSSQTEERVLDGSKLFSLERLLSIYAQMHHKVTNKCLAGYADADTQAMVRAAQIISLACLMLRSPSLCLMLQIASLVQGQLLFHAPGPQFRLYSPRYGSRISDALAQQLARSFGFSIQEYMFHPNTASFHFR